MIASHSIAAVPLSIIGFAAMAGAISVTTFRAPMFCAMSKPARSSATSRSRRANSSVVICQNRPSAIARTRCQPFCSDSLPSIWPINAKASDDQVRAFYARFGFETLPHDPHRAMFIRLADLAENHFAAQR